MQFTRTNIITEGGTGKSLSTGGIVLEGNQGGGGGEYIHPTGWLWGNRYTGRETLDGDLTSNGTIRALNINATNITSVNGDFTNLTSVNLTSENGDFRYLNVYDNLYAWGADIDHATIRELFVSGSAHFVELIIDKINSTNGSLILSPAHAELTRVEEVNGNVYCYFPASDGDKEISNDFDIDDLVICESFNAVEGVSHDVDNKFIWKRVIGKGTTDNGDSESESDTDGFKKEHYIIVKASSFSDDEYVASGTNTEFERGDVICTLGNWTKPSRQKAILMTSTNPKFLDIGTSNPDPYDVTVWGDEPYLRTAPIGVCNDVCRYDNLTNEIIRDVYPLVYSSFTSDYYRDAFITNDYQDLKTGYKITLKIRPHFDTTHYDINKYDNDCYKDDDVNNLIIFKMQSFGILRQFVLHKSSTEWWGEYKYMLVKFGFNDNNRTWNKCYKVRDLNLTDNEATTIVITDADNTYGEEISKFKIAHPQGPTTCNEWWLCNYIVGSIGNPFSFNTGEPEYGEYYKNNCVYLNNEVYDYYNYKFLNPDNIVLASYKVTDLSVGDEAYKYQEEVIPNGNFNDNRHWLTTFPNAPEGYSDFINAKECVYMRRPLCKEVYVYGSTQMGGMSGNYLKSDEFTFPYNFAIYELSFDYYVGNDNSVNDEQFYFQFTIHDVYRGTDHHKIIFPDKVGYHKCRIYLSVHPKETTLYESYYIPNVIHLHYEGIVDGVDRVDKLPYYISFNTDMCGNQNQLVIDNVHLRAVKGNFSVFRNELTNVYTYDSTTERRYRGGSVNPIEAPAIITFNNINEFSLADKHVSVLSPTYNLISASSISGLDDLTNSISSLNTRVTNCETNIETNASQIALKADKSTVNTLTGEVNDLSSQLLIQAGEISSAVTSISTINGEITQLDTRITQNATAISLQATAITSLNDSISSLSSELTIQAGQISSLVSSVSSIDGEVVSLWSSITQLPDEISAYVYEEIGDELQRTGIDITNGSIVLDATKTDITGDLTLSDADQGVAIQNQGVDKILIQNSSLGTVDDFDFGADKIISNSVSNITCPEVLTYSIELGNLSATTPLNIQNINFNAWQTNGDVNYLEGYSYTYTLKCDGSSVTSVNGNVVFGNQGHNTVFMTSLNITSLPSTGAYTLDFSISNMQYTSILSGNISYTYFIKVKSVSPGINRISLDGAVFSSDTTKYNWFGADKSVIRRDNSQLVVTNQGIYRTSLDTEYFNVQNGMPIGDISTTIPIRRVYDQTYTATEKDGLITFNYSLSADGNRRTLTLPNPRRIVEGKWFMVKNNVNDNTIVTSPPYDQYSQTDLIMPEDSTTPVETYQCGNKSMKFVNDGWQWIVFYCG